MAAKGTESKTKITKQILNQFPGSFEKDKKIYIPMLENGEKIQIALSLTWVKNPVGKAADDGFNWDIEDQSEITPEEKKNIETLMKELGL